jgi:hypothetical protein
MIDRVEREFNWKPARLIGDMAYGSAKLLDWMVNKKVIEPHVPVWDKTQRNDETLSSSDFQWNEQADEYRCPQGHALRSQWRAFQNPRTHVTKAHLPIQPIRLRNLPDESALLSERAVSKNHSQRP